MVRCMYRGFLGLFFLAGILPFMIGGVSDPVRADSETAGDPLLSSIIHLDSGVRAAVFVEKEKQLLHLYENRTKGLTRVSTVSCSTGEVPGRKMVSGDKKTPEGVYFFTREFLDRELTPVYGTRAFPIDYPNVVDRLENRTGSAIWLHGTNKIIRPRESNGCVALANADINSLADTIELNMTPVIISESFGDEGKNMNSPSAEVLFGFLDKWAYALRSGSYHDYLKFYSSSYLPDISWWTPWSRLRKSSVFESGNLSISLGAVSLYRVENTILATFTQAIKVDEDQVDVGVRKLYLKDGEDGLVIVGDEFLSPLGKGDPLVSVAAGFAKKLNAARAVKQRDAELFAFVGQWAEAWQSGDMGDYGNCYSGAFRSSGMDKGAWVSRKRWLSRKYKFIQVSLGQVKVEEEGDAAAVSFVQDYRSSAYRAVGRKKLLLKLEDGEWKIYSETWKKS